MAEVPRREWASHASAEPLDARFRSALHSLGVGDRPAHLLVAFSGGLDSTVLLYLLRFRTQGLPLMVSAAHLDHGMRPSSAGDAAWVRGLCAAWGVPLETTAILPGLSGETRAREVRYDFLREARERAGADYLVTAHHADDQAETVLFRILRGTGITGLAGIPAVTSAGLLRPLLGFWREELEEFATRNRLSWRTDPTNLEAGPARNQLRLGVLPLIEREFAPAARRNLVALAELARESEDGWDAIVRDLYPTVVTSDGESLLVARDRIQACHPAISSRLIREALRHFGVVPDRAGTRLVISFITGIPSGRVLELADGVRVRSEFDRVRIERAASLPPDSPLQIPRPESSTAFQGTVRLGGAVYRVEVRSSGAEGAPPGDVRWIAELPVDGCAFPLLLRARAPGDRIRLASGTRMVKKLLIDRRVPGGERARLPVLVDAAGTILWIAGIGPASGVDAAGTDALEILIRDG
ncbi:MAG: tRNA lysidine(34) synthetase TilS [Gemmatimonadota bacterium]|jgi:tRNA(Ile)-lysidine synthase|nr:tRNA lysidine(34) synthetase TilS [Gemmatimonadota bacterium]